VCATRFRDFHAPLKHALTTKGNLIKRNKLMGVKLILWYTKFAIEQVQRFTRGGWHGSAEFQSAILH
jgi:hypothetical protein